MDIVSRKRINLLISLAGITRIDSHTPAVKLILHVATECDFSTSELKELVDSPEPIGSFGALSPNQKEQYMYNLCELMALVELNEFKKLLCQKVAHDLGYSNMELIEITNRFQKKVLVVYPA